MALPVPLLRLLRAACLSANSCHNVSYPTPSNTTYTSTTTTRRRRRTGADRVYMAARSWTLEGPQLQLTFEGCDFNFIMAMRLWSLAGAMGAPFFAGIAAGGFLGSLVPIAAWLNPHSTTGYAVEVSKFFNIQPLGMQFLISRMVRSGLTMEEARAHRLYATRTLA
jgi:hypothetical protein